MANKRISQLTNTITAFRTGDVIPVDGPSGTVKMSKDDLLNVTSFANKGQIFNTYSGNPASLNDLKDNKCYIVQRTASTTTTNFPSDYPTSGTGILVCMKGEWQSGRYQVLQMLTNLTINKTWRRIYQDSGTWGAWSSPTEKKTIEPIEKQIFDNWNQNLADLNDAVVNSVYMIQRTANTTTLNLPSDYTSGTALMYVHKAYYNTNDYQILQYIVKLGTGETWQRNYTYHNSGTWGAWSKHTPYSPTNNVIHVGSGQAYTTIRSALDYAYTIGDVSVYVHPGTYDLCQEFSDVLPTISSRTGCKLGKGLHLVCYAGVSITANVEKGDYTDAQFNAIKEMFEPFAAESGNFIVENLNIESKNTRYCVHDEMAGFPSPYIHKYINCKMKHTATSTTNASNYIQCIGGGLGKYGTIIIDGGCYEVVTSVGSPTTQGGDVDYAQICISYHNNGTYDDSVSSITLKDVFFKDRGYIRLGDYGQTLLMTNVVASGCRFGLPILHKWEAADSHDNFVVEAEWNNDQSVAGEWSVSGNIATFVPA